MNCRNRKKEKILSEVDLMDLNITEKYLLNVFSDNISLNSFLASVKLFQNTMLCERCNDGTRLRHVRRKPSPDCFHWFCHKTCRSTASLRKDSIFSGSRLSMRTIVFIMYKYINRTPINDIAYELDIDRGTVSEYTDLVREVICDYVITKSDKKED
ncbi:hypothetical protein DMUE_2029 [Dictyocoela muelleri]|nr:hypothetical protein DMUE_2029 [Dictyocoela muelleri]